MKASTLIRIAAIAMGLQIATATAVHAGFSTNGVNFNGINFNGLTSNGYSGNGVKPKGLNVNGINTIGLPGQIADQDAPFDIRSLVQKPIVKEEEPQSEE